MPLLTGSSKVLSPMVKRAVSVVMRAPILLRWCSANVNTIRCILYPFKNILLRETLLTYFKAKMLTQNRRPIFLNMFLIRFPITAFASGFHRISGIFLFLIIPFLLERLQRSLFNEITFELVKTELASPISKLVILCGLGALIYHLIAGVRHFLMDVEIGDSATAGRIGAKLVFILFAIAMIGVILWLF